MKVALKILVAQVGLGIKAKDVVYTLIENLTLLTLL